MARVQDVEYLQRCALSEPVLALGTVGDRDGHGVPRKLLPRNAGPFEVRHNFLLKRS